MDLIINTDTMAYTSFGLMAGAIALFLYAVLQHEPTKVPRLGLRGLRRHEARTRLAGFPLFEPAIRLAGGWIAVLPITSLRTSCDRKLRYAGDYLGLSADEWLGMCLVIGMISGTFGFLGVSFVGLPFFFIPATAVAGTYLSFSSVDTAIASRRSSIERDLSSAIDLMALCMSAGLTFPAAIRNVASQWPQQNDPIVQELRQVLNLIELGHTRAYALRRFGERIPCDSVSDFVAAVIQSETKGTPLQEVLAIQAGVVRSRRTTMVEEAAAKAAVKLVFPLMLLLLSLFIIVVGPLALRTAQWSI